MILIGMRTLRKPIILVGTYEEVIDNQGTG